MVKITIIVLGKFKEKYLREAESEYLKRLSRVNLKIIELEPERLSENPSATEIDTALSKEAKKILAKIPNGAYKIPLCIEGGQYDSVEFANLTETVAVNGFSSICFIIGSSYGLSSEVKAIADKKISLSRMTFPHQIARIMLLEQIYRSYKILNGGTYHK